MRAAVIGIGRIGWELEKDPLRSKPHSHVGAYLANPKTELAAVVDLDRRKLEDFKIEHSDIAVYADYEKMLNEAKPEIVSICTPTETHTRIARNCARFNSTKVLWVEKPLASTIGESEKIIKTCEQFHVALSINHTRRWDHAYRRIKRILDGRDESLMDRPGRDVRFQAWSIGELLAFSGRFSGDPIGDGVHMADLGLWLTNGDASKIHLLNVPSPYLLFEADLWGENGLIRVLNNGEEIQLWSTQESPTYGGFRELGPMINLEETYDFSQAMLNAVDDLAECATSDKQPECDGRCGLEALRLALETQGG